MLKLGRVDLKRKLDAVDLLGVWAHLYRARANEGSVVGWQRAHKQDIPVQYRFIWCLHPFTYCAKADLRKIELAAHDSGAEQG